MSTTCNLVPQTPSMCMVTGPCGHDSEFEAAAVGVDRYRCPVCGLEWHVSAVDRQMILPERKVCVESQMWLVGQGGAL